MSNMKPCRKAVEAVDKIIDLLEKEKISFEEVADIPAELQRRINYGSVPHDGKNSPDSTKI